MGLSIYLHWQLRLLRVFCRLTPYGVWGEEELQRFVHILGLTVLIGPLFLWHVSQTKCHVQGHVHNQGETTLLNLIGVWANTCLVVKVTTVIAIAAPLVKARLMISERKIILGA